MNGTGLTLGKFDPLHRGHQSLIETALSEMDQVYIVVYDCPDITTYPFEKRCEWIRTLYPTAEVIEGRDGPSDIGDTPEIKKIQEDFILKILNGREITHFYSSEFYGEHMSQALNATNRMVDEARQHVAISATKIRNNPYQNRQYLDPLVYRDLITKVVFLGAPSTGKTTLTKRLAEKYKTVWMPEYGREYWDTNQIDRRLTLEQLLDIAKGHLERENTLILDANQYIFIDTNAWTTHLFSQYYHGQTHPKLLDICEKIQARYQVVFLCDTDIPYDDTWDRSGDANRNDFQKKIIKDLNQRKVSFTLLSGDLEKRIQDVTFFLSRRIKAAIK